MAKAKNSKASNEVRKDGIGSILLAEEVNRVEVLLDQIEGCVSAMQSHLRERYDYDADSGTQALLEVIKERAGDAAGMVSRAYGKLPEAVLELRELNIKSRAAHERELDERAAEHARRREERGEKIKKSLDRIA